MNIRMQIVRDMAEDMGAYVLVNQPCPDCRAPLIEKPGQDIPFCGFCVSRRVAAQHARDLLIKAKLAEQGFILNDMHPAPEANYRPPWDESEFLDPFRFGGSL